MHTEQHAIVLLSQELRLAQKPEGPRPLSIGELANLDQRLASRQLSVADLLEDTSLQQESAVVGDDGDRVQALLERGFQMAMAIQRWDSRAITAVCRNQTEYPQAVLSRLGNQAPPVVYCVGDPSLMQAESIAILPPRTRDQDVIDYAARIGGAVTKAGASLVSGVGKLTESALVGAASTTIGIVRGSLEAAALDRRYRQPVMDCQLTLVSATDPIARQSDESVDRLVRAFAGRVFVIEPGPPPGWREERQAA